MIFKLNLAPVFQSNIKHNSKQELCIPAQGQLGKWFNIEKNLEIEETASIFDDLKLHENEGPANS